MCKHYYLYWVYYPYYYGWSWTWLFMKSCLILQSWLLNRCWHPHSQTRGMTGLEDLAIPNPQLCLNQTTTLWFQEPLPPPSSIRHHPSLLSLSLSCHDWNYMKSKIVNHFLKSSETWVIQKINALPLLLLLVFRIHIIPLFHITMIRLFEVYF